LNQQRSGRSCLPMPDDHRDVIDFLSTASAYWTAVDPVEIIQADVSPVFFAGDRAYKLKRAVKLPYLDISTVEQRRVAGDLLDWRAAAGKVRRGHGELHLRNVFLLEGRPTLFDAFNSLTSSSLSTSSMTWPFC